MTSTTQAAKSELSFYGALTVGSARCLYAAEKGRKKDHYCSPCFYTARLVADLKQGWNYTSDTEQLSFHILHVIAIALCQHRLRLMTRAQASSQCDMSLEPSCTSCRRTAAVPQASHLPKKHSCRSANV